MRSYLVLIGIVLFLPLCGMAQNLMGPSDSIGSVTYNFSANGDEGIKNQTQVATGAPPIRSDDWLFTTALNYQNLNLNKPAFTTISHLNFEGLSLSANAIANHENGNGWFFGLNFGSASDEMFISSDVITYNAQIQRKNKWSENSNIYYGLFYSNNNALLPGLPFPVFAYEYVSPENGDTYRFGVPIIIRIKEMFKDTQFSAFAIGPVIWDVRWTNQTLSSMTFSTGFQRRPETFLLANPPGDPNVNQLMVDNMAAYAAVDFNILKPLVLTLRYSRQFNNRFRLRETGTTESDLDQNRDFKDYDLWGLSIRWLIQK